jgi:alkane 1-monooxygenase
MSTSASSAGSPVSARAPEGALRPWRDGKYFMWPAALVVPLLPYVAFGVVRQTGLGLFWWMTPGLVFVLIPILDVYIGDDGGNPPASMMQRLQDDWWYRLLTFLYIPLQYGALALGCYAWTDSELGWVGRLGLMLSIGTVNGIAINTAHELGHRSERLEQWLSKIALAPSMYGHFFVEHNRGHHANVATPEDPASSRLGESFWAFLPRTVLGSLRSAWDLESRRWSQRGKSRWTWRNQVLHSWAMTLVLFGALVWAFGGSVLPLLVVQAGVGFGLLELVNYLEHYGLSRERNAAGRYVKVEPRHSWNSNRLATNLFLYQLQRHSDHHANPTLRYQALRHFDSAPQLPAGYATMIVVALFPPLWRRVMDHRVVEHYGGDVTLANLDPAEQQRFLQTSTPSAHGG